MKRKCRESRTTGHKTVAKYQCQFQSIIETMLDPREQHKPEIVPIQQCITNKAFPNMNASIFSGVRVEHRQQK